MKWGWFSLAGILAYGLFLVATLPMQHAVNLLNARGLPIVVAQGTGSVWNGEAEHINYENVILGPVKWQFLPLSLLWGQLKYQLEIQDHDQILIGKLARELLSNRFRLTELKGNIPLETLLLLSGEANPSAGGKLDFDVVELTISNRQIISAEGAIRWLDASIRSPIRIALGNLQFDLFNDDEVVKSDVTDLNGPIKVQAQISLPGDGTYQFQGELMPGKSADQGLVNLLQSLGRPTAEGSIQIDYTGQY
jgi:hypothetical protein